jgi:hypothetical protein
MAQVFSGVEEIKTEKTEATYLSELKQHAAIAAEQRGDNSDLIGETVKWVVGDSWAEYLIWSSEPLELIHFGEEEAYQIDDAHMRGLRLSDVREKVELDRKLAKSLGDQRIREN